MLRIDSGVCLDEAASLHLAAEVFLPAGVESRPIALICLPGGGMNRRYFDLRPDDGDSGFSFAAQMSARGFVVVTLDYPGIGDSDRPADGYALTHELVTQACVQAIGTLLDGLRKGSLIAGVAAMPALRSIGVGHSMGGMFTVLTQASARLHAAIAVLGFSTRGLPGFIPADARELAHDPQALRAKLVDFARASFVESYPAIRSSPRSGGELFGGAHAEPKAVAALKAARSPLLPVPAFLAMVPGNVAPEAALIDVPVFIGLGEQDMAGSPHEVPRAFGRSRDVTLQILPEAGHSHFLFGSRVALFDSLAQWASGMPL